MQVQRQQLLDVAVEHPLGAHEIGGGAVAIGVAQLARERPLVDLQTGVTRARPHDTEQPLDLALAACAAHQVGGHQRARIDHRVVRTVVSLVEHDRVERVATGLDAHSGQDVLPAVVGQRERVGEHL